MARPEGSYIKLLETKMALFNLFYPNNPDLTTLRSAKTDGMANKVIKRPVRIADSVDLWT